MAFAINYNAVRSLSDLGGAPKKFTKSDAAPMFINGYYPRGFIVLTGGTLTVWVENESNSGQTVKRDLGTVPDGFSWTYGGFFGICSTDEAGNATTCDNIIAIP